METAIAAPSDVSATRRACGACAYATLAPAHDAVLSTANRAHATTRLITRNFVYNPLGPALGLAVAAGLASAVPIMKQLASTVALPFA